MSTLWKECYTVQCTVHHAKYRKNVHLVQGALYTVQSSDKNIHPLQGVLYTLQSTDKNVYLMQGVVHTIQSTKKCIPCARCAVRTPCRVQKKVSTLCKVCCTYTGQSAEKMSTLCKVCCTPCWVQIKMSTHIARCDTLAVHHAEYRKISSLCKEYPTVQSRKKCAASAKNIQPCTVQKKCLPIARCAVHRVEYRKNVPQLQGVLYTV